jgi:hypothetical protein
MQQLYLLYKSSITLFISFINYGMLRNYSARKKDFYEQEYGYFRKIILNQRIATS